MYGRLVSHLLMGVAQGLSSSKDGIVWFSSVSASAINDSSCPSSISSSSLITSVSSRRIASLCCKCCSLSTRYAKPSGNLVSSAAHLLYNSINTSLASGCTSNPTTPVDVFVWPLGVGTPKSPHCTPSTPLGSLSSFPFCKIATHALAAPCHYVPW